MVGELTARQKNGKVMMMCGKVSLGQIDAENAIKFAHALLDIADQIVKADKEKNASQRTSRK